MVVGSTILIGGTVAGFIAFNKWRKLEEAQRNRFRELHGPRPSDEEESG
jgi:hypothetical protein